MMKIIDLKFQGLNASIASFLIETTAGPVLVETGPHSCLPHLTKGLKDSGYAISDVAAVFLTHIHLDHAGAAWVFADAGADIYLHPFGARHMADPSKLMSSAKRIYLDKMDELWGDMRAIDESRLKIAEDYAAITIGDKTFIAHHTPGHAVHHIAWQCDNVLFAGDVAGVKIGNGPVVPPCPPPDINIEDWKSSIARILKLNLSELYLTHYGIVPADGIPVHLKSLETMLDAWAQWMLPRYKNGEDPKEVTPQFQAYAEQQLVDAGLPAERIRQYDAANPAWMSVAGLMRYWHKRLNA